MAIVTFYSTAKKEAAQTLSLVATATYMAIEHNYKILIVSTSFDDLSLENCFWEYDKIRPTGIVKNEKKNVGLDSGIEGLIKVLRSNKTSTEIVKDYSRTVLRDRLDILLAPATKDDKEYTQIASNYVEIIQTANRYYDFVFVDLNKHMPQQEAETIKQMSDIDFVGLTQNLKNMNDFIDLRENNEFYRRRNIMLFVGKYDRFSKYNNKNIMRYLKEKKELCVVPYNTLFFEACSEGTVIDFLLKIRNLADETDRNASFVNELKQTDKNILAKIQELQMRQ